MNQQIYVGNCINILQTLPSASVDVIFADPPYNLQLQNELLRPDMSVVDGVSEDWDKFNSFLDYDTFTIKWLGECHRVLKDTGTLWVIGSYHNIFRVGTILQDLGFWVLNDVIWHKSNPTPNFRGTRFTNATETLIWVKKDPTARVTFNYHAMKHFNDDKQMQNVWRIPVCSGNERIKLNGEKAHPTQKPEALLYRVLLASSQPGDLVLDPFFGTGTTGAVAKKLKRQFIGIEQSQQYADIAAERIAAIDCVDLEDALLLTPSRRTAAKVKFSALIAENYVPVGARLYDKTQTMAAVVKADSYLNCLHDGFEGSIHKAAAHCQGTTACNGWDYWFYINTDRQLVSIDTLRTQYRKDNDLS